MASTPLHHILPEQLDKGIPEKLLHSWERVTLSPHQREVQFPDLLALQKKGYTEFVDHYIHKLFDDISPVQDITGGKLHVSIGNIAVGEPLDDIATCKKKEMTYGGIITGKITLINNEHIERTAKKAITLPEMKEVSVATDTIFKKDKDGKLLKTALVKKWATATDVQLKQIDEWYTDDEKKEFLETQEVESGKNLTIAKKGELLTIEQWRAIENHYGRVESVELIDQTTKKKTLFTKKINIGIMPLMTPYGSFIINGVERVIISQIVRSYGIFFGKKDQKYSCKLIPERGPWLEMFIEKSGVIMARVNKSRKFPISALLRVLGIETDEGIREVFQEVYDEDDTHHIDLTLEKDSTTDASNAALFIYNKIRPGELIDADSAADYIKTQFLSPERIDLGRIARRKINAKLGLKKSLDDPSAQLFDGVDIVASVAYLSNIANNKKGYYIDDSDHLSNKRIRTMGEILHARLQPIMRRFTKSIKGKLSILNPEDPVKLTSLVNFKIIDNAIKSFFATSQLSQFLDQINPLAEIEHKRRITALGPGGLKKQTAKFEVRDVHPSHYGRICPIQTPEWQNIGLVLYQAMYSTVNQEGFLETPALKAFHTATPTNVLNKLARKDIFELGKNGKPTKKLIVKEDSYIDKKAAEKIKAQYKKNDAISVRPYVTGEMEYISPEMDERFIIADATSPMDEYGNITTKRVAGRHFVEMEMFHVSDITHIDVTPSQIFSVNTGLIPFVNHNYDVRANVASNQQRQALPLLRNEAPLVGTGLEREMLHMTHAAVVADDDGEVIYVDGKRIKVKYGKDIKEHTLVTFSKSNQKSVIHQKAMVNLWDKVKKWDLLAEWPSADHGELAIGVNLKIAILPWEWYNYEDAIVISSRLVTDDVLTSVKIEEYEIEVADTKLWPEQTTNDIPGVGLNKLKNLDVDGIIRIGSSVKGGDLLVGKITPKSEGELSPEEKLIQAIFGDKSKSVRDTSLYMPSGSQGKVIDVVVLDAKKGDNLMAGVKKKIKVYVAMTRKIEVGDKLANKHGNKGIISVVVPEEDMPYTADGEPIDVVVNPMGVISRMNIGQVFELQLSYIAKQLGVKFAIPSFSGITTEHLVDLASAHDLSPNGKVPLYDGKTGEQFERDVTVWYMQMLKLNHMVEDKIHARAVGPYSLITQQPLGGKARDGGQRFGEMEVWALEAYSAVYTLQEMLTIKSDDVYGRNKTYDSIIKGLKPKVWGLPESFNYVTYLFRGLAQNIEPLNETQIEKLHQERVEKIKSLGLAGITSDTESKKKDTSIESVEEKNEMIDNMIEEMKDFGDIDED